MLAPLLLLVLLVTGGWYQRHAESRLTPSDLTARQTASEILMLADAVNDWRYRYEGTPALQDLDLPWPLPAGIHFTVHNDRLFIWTREQPGLLSALRAAARQSVLVLTVSNGTQLMASGTPMGVPLPSGITDSDIVYLN